MITIRLESAADIPARETLLDAAFGDDRFTKTCERFREGRIAAQGLSLVAQDDDGRVVGTVRLWHAAAAGRPLLLLGPLAVAAGLRSEGIGRRLMREALWRAATAGHGAVILVGDAPYYARFGFSPAPAALDLPGPFARERFLALELADGALRGIAGIVRPTGAIAFPVVEPARELRIAA